MRQVLPSPPYINRRGRGLKLHCLAQHGRTKSRSQSPHVSLARGSAGTRKSLSELSRIERHGANSTHGLEKSSHANRCCFRKSEKRVLEIRPTGRRQRKAQPSPVAQTRTRKTVGSHLIPFSRGSSIAAATLVDVCAVDVAPVGSECSHGSGLVHETRFSRSIARTRS